MYTHDNTHAVKLSTNNHSLLKISTFVAVVTPYGTKCAAKGHFGLPAEMNQHHWQMAQCMQQNVCHHSDSHETPVQLIGPTQKWSPDRFFIVKNGPPPHKLHTN